VFGKPLFGDEEIMEVVDSLRNGWIGTGPKAERFEQALAEHAGVALTVPDRRGFAGGCGAGGAESLSVGRGCC
jgi:hypothetical protein